MDFFNRTFRIGRLFGVNVHIHILFILYMAWELLQSKGDYRWTLIFFGVLFGIVLLHELGHCLGAKSVGGDAENILLWPLGGIAFANAPMTPWAQFVTVAAGPAVNVLICAACAAVLVGSTGSMGAVTLNPFGSPTEPLTEMWQVYVYMVFDLSYALFLFNMLPIFPMDGGQLFRALLWPSMGLHRATILAAQVGIAGAVVFAIWGIQSGSWMMVAIAFFGGSTAWQHLQMAKFGIMQEEYIAHRYGRPRRGGDENRPGFMERLRATMRPKLKQQEPYNPNPGGWERKMREQDELEAELDRILTKVHEQGIHSLSYVERQTLERATRERQKREREFGRVE